MTLRAFQVLALVAALLAAGSAFIAGARGGWRDIDTSDTDGAEYCAGDLLKAPNRPKF